ncbi:glycerate kinase, partial [Chitinivorax tropicus]
DRTTAGVGRLIRHALERGATHIEVALGGSATNDGGVGMLAELGCRFLDHAGHPIVPTLTGLGVLASVEASGLDARLRGGSLSILSDVVNPLCGASGASYVFGPQKGMLPAQCDEFDCILGRYAGLLQSVLRVGEVAQSPGAGAAGGLGFALQCLGGVQQSGARQIANRIGLPAAIAQADWVLTGEGRTDAQTLSGKAPVEVARLARAAGVPVTLVSGGLVKADIEKLSAEFDGLFSVVCGPMTLVQAQTEAAELLTQQVAQLARFARATRGW